jgi:hypothetical protein
VEAVKFIGQSKIKVITSNISATSAPRPILIHRDEIEIMPKEIFDEAKDGSK